MIILGLTGGLGTGKSTVAKMFTVPRAAGALVLAGIVLAGSRISWCEESMSPIQLTIRSDKPRYAPGEVMTLIFSIQRTDTKETTYPMRFYLSQWCPIEVVDFGSVNNGCSKLSRFDRDPRIPDGALVATLRPGEAAELSESSRLEELEQCVETGPPGFIEDEANMSEYANKSVTNRGTQWLGLTFFARPVQTDIIQQFVPRQQSYCLEHRRFSSEYLVRAHGEAFVQEQQGLLLVDRKFAPIVSNAIRVEIQPR